VLDGRLLLLTQRSGAAGRTPVHQLVRQPSTNSCEQRGTYFVGIWLICATLLNNQERE